MAPGGSGMLLPLLLVVLVEGLGEVTLPVK